MPASEKLWSAVKTIIVADFVMSLDNVIAIAGAAEQADPSQRTGLIIFGLLVSVPFIVFGSQVILRLLDRFPIVILLGGALLGWIAGGLIIGDSFFKDLVPQGATTRHVVSAATAALVVLIAKVLQARRNASGGAKRVTVALDFALKTHPGLVRPLNEDAIGADPSCGLFALADGLGGYNAGEVASVMAISSVLERLSSALSDSRESDVVFTPDEAIYDTINEINSAIYNAALNSAAFEGMATTLVVGWFLGERLWVAHTGDSRLYRYRDDQLEQLTRDHSFSQELLDAGMVTEEEARILPAKNLVTRALGASPEIEPEVQDLDVAAGDLILLCSDGLTEMVGSYEIAGLLAAQADMHETARRLVDLANEAGGRDNVSVIVVKVTGKDESDASASAHDEG